MLSFKTPAALSLLLALSGTAMASANKCNAGPQDQWQPLETLETRLRIEGWTIKKAKIDSGCYKVVATKGKDLHMKAYFNPKTLETLKDG